MDSGTVMLDVVLWVYVHTHDVGPMALQDMSCSMVFVFTAMDRRVPLVCVYLCVWVWVWVGGVAAGLQSMCGGWPLSLRLYQALCVSVVCLSLPAC